MPIQKELKELFILRGLVYANALEVQELATCYQGRIDAAQIKQIFRNWYNKNQQERTRARSSDLSSELPIYSKTLKYFILYFSVSIIPKLKLCVWQTMCK